MKYNKLGQTAESNDLIFAELIDGPVQKVYYVLTYNNLLYDPLGPDSNREQNLSTKLKKTSKNTFDSYVKYLQSKNRLHLTQAQRSYING
jgi:hypothetical protein